MSASQTPARELDTYRGLSADEKSQINEFTDNLTPEQEHYLEHRAEELAHLIDTFLNSPNGSRTWQFIDDFVDKWLRTFLPREWANWPWRRLRYLRSRVVKVMSRIVVVHFTTILIGPKQILRWCDRAFGGFDGLQMTVNRIYLTGPPPSPERPTAPPAYLVPAPSSPGHRRFQPLFSPLPPGSPPLEDSDDENEFGNVELWAPLQ
ncbi:hypothetical protein PM082_024733 [Marasmius tenuissimus]|nr:hypothetical protein PM082_024733 [Marasmius tenuissimus]